MVRFRGGGQGLLKGIGGFPKNIESDWSYAIPPSKSKREKRERPGPNEVERARPRLTS